ncbi:MAG TPA: hypothetical protein VN327_04865 [Pseudonocardiaceae bacterium]|jgi:hypothetical protein|nr:hypothetical protein [Pseudonocardiaceae bacterium]
MIKRLVCLANSRKLHGRCIAGRELLARNLGEWIRPVSDREGEEVSDSERKYEDGGDPRVLDIIDVPLIGPKVKSHQSENWLLDPSKYWRKVGEFGHRNLSFLADAPGPLWINGHQTNNGQNDCVPVEEADKTDGSLKLIAVASGLQLCVCRTGENFGNPRRRAQAEFSFGGMNYRLWVTDPLIETEYLARVDGVYALGSSYLTISLGEPWDGRCYKLVAAIIGALP